MDHARQYIYIQVHSGLTADDVFNNMRPKLFGFQNSHSYCVAHAADRYLLTYLLHGAESFLRS